MKSFLVFSIYNLNNFIRPVKKAPFVESGLPTVDNIQLVYSDYKMDTQMTVQDYLLKFRKISSLESLEKLFDHLNYSLTDTEEIVNMYRAADHRRAELVSGGKLFDVGQVPKSVWRYVQ
jgi:hypothetical protein